MSEITQTNIIKEKMSCMDALPRHKMNLSSIMGVNDSEVVISTYNLKYKLLISSITNFIFITE